MQFSAFEYGVQHLRVASQGSRGKKRIVRGADRTTAVGNRRNLRQRNRAHGQQRGREKHQNQDESAKDIFDQLAKQSVRLRIGGLAWRRSGYARAQGLLELLRLAIVVLGAFILNQPEWVEEYRPIEKPAIAVLWDASPSMGTRDVGRGEATSAQPGTRRAAIEHHNVADPVAHQRKSNRKPALPGADDQHLVDVFSGRMRAPHDPGLDRMAQHLEIRTHCS